MGVFCVNTKSSDFKNTAKRLDIHPDSLEVYVHLYLNQAASTNYMEATEELPFPSDEEIREYFFPDNRENGTQAIDAWVERYGATDGFISDSEVKEATRLYGTGNVHTYMNYKGNIVHRVSRPNIASKRDLKYLLTKLNIIDAKGDLLGISREKFYDRMKALAIPAELYMPFDKELKKQVALVFKRNPELAAIGTEEQYIQYLATIFPNSLDKSIYWHGSNSDFSEGFASAKREEGSGALETKNRNDFYLAKQAWSVLQYVNGVNRKSVDKNGFAHWNKLWWELKEIMSNGRRENNDWKDLVINSENVRQAIPNKKGVFNRDTGGENGKWLKERKADYGYENKSDKEFFEEILGVKWGEDTFHTWTQRNAEIFKSLEETEKGIYPAVINTLNPIRETGQNTYYEEQRGLMSKADREGYDAIIGTNTDNEFGSDIAVILRNNDNVHFLGTTADKTAFSEFVAKEFPSTINTIQNSNNYTQEMLDIKNQAIADGTFMKAPNGKDTNLTERQWLQVRTKAFKKWFGDWEKIAPRLQVSDDKKLQDILHNIANSNSRFSTLAKFILDNHLSPRDLGEVLIDKDFPLAHQSGWYSELEDPQRGIIRYIGFQANNVPEETFNGAILHEIIHSLTHRLLKIYKSNPNSVPENIRVAIGSLYEIIDYSKKYILDNYNLKEGSDREKLLSLVKRQNFDKGYLHKMFYAFDETSNPESEHIDEFISEIFTNPAFQEMLNSIPYKETKKTLWDKIKECIQNIFGIPINKGSVLEEALKASTEFITKAKKEYDSVSKVVDENGEPLVVYHGTPNEFTTFDKEKIGSTTDYGVFGTGFYFALTPSYANIYGNNVNSFFLNIKNPYHGIDAGGVLNNKEYRPRDIEEAYSSAYETAIKRGKSKEDASRIAEKTKQSAIDRNNKNAELLRGNYDGVDATGEKVNSSEKQFIVFEPNQIKSATDDNGEFSTENDNVYYQKSILTELSKLKRLNQPLTKAGSPKKMKERLKNANLDPIIVNAIMKAVETDGSLASLTPLLIFNLVTRQQEKGLAQQYNEYIQKPIDRALEEHLLKFLEPFHVTSIEEDLMATHGVTGIYDIINKVIHLAKAEDRNAITVTEEVAHAIVELLGAKKSRKEENKDYTFLFDNIESTDIYKKVYEEYKDTYLKKDGQGNLVKDTDGNPVPDINKIKKEAIGQALAVAINNKWENKHAESENSFWAKLKEWIEQIFKFFTDKDYINIDTLLNQIATEVIHNNYSRFKKVDNSNYRLLDYAESIANQNKQDGGKALEFMQFFSNDMGNIITGSIAYRKQGPVYRGKLDALHDIDMEVPLSVHGIPLQSSIIQHGIKSALLTSELRDFLLNTEYFKKILAKYPKMKLASAFSDKVGGIVCNAVYSEDESLSKRFMNLSGSYASRLDTFTEEERKQIYLFDFFFKASNNVEFIDEPSYNLKLKKWPKIFDIKIHEMGRAKDIFDYQMWDVFEEFKSEIMSDDEYLMFQKPIVYNPEQQEAIRQAGEYLADKNAAEDFFLITGKAGTGKTTIINEIIKNETERTGVAPSVFITAVSNKAVKVLSGKIEAPHQARAIASSFKLLKFRDENGNIGFRFPKRGWDPTKALISQSDIIIIDEASMIGGQVIKAIQRFKQYYPNKKFILLGDVNQLPAIKDPENQDLETESLSVFSYDNKREVKLLTRVRQGEASPILSFSDKFAETDIDINHYIEEGKKAEEQSKQGKKSSRTAKMASIPDISKDPSVITKEGAVIFYKDSTSSIDEEIVDSLVPIFKEAQQTKNPNLVKIVAIHVALVSAYNHAIYKKLHPEETEESLPLHEGDLIMFYNQYGKVPIPGTNMSEPLFFNSDEAAIKKVLSSPLIYDYGISLEEFDKLTKGHKANLPQIIVLDVELEKNGNSHKITMACPKEGNLFKLQNFINNVWSIIRNISDFDAKKQLEEFALSLEDNIAQIDLGYAVSIHKSLGSTYDVVVVDAKDVMGLKKQDGFPTIEKIKGLYTGITRASNITVMLRGTQTLDGSKVPETAILDVKAINTLINKNKSGEEVSDREFERVINKSTEKEVSSEEDTPSSPTKQVVSKQETTTSEEDNRTPMEVEDAKWEAIFQEHESTIDFIEDSHEYYYYPQGKEHPESRVKMDTSVTSITNPVERRYRNPNDGLDWLDTSAAIGSSADKAVRDFFRGIDITTRKYPNLTNELLQQLSKDLKNFKLFLDNKFAGTEYKVVTNPFALVGKITKYNGDTQTLGGTLDILIYDEDGFYYIYDIKTSRNDLRGKEKLNNYTSLVNMYREMLEAMHPELRGCCGGLGILQLSTFYATPKGLPFNGSIGTTMYTVDNTGQLLANGKPIEVHKDYVAPHFIDGDVQKAVIDIKGTIPEQHYADKRHKPVTVSALDIEKKFKKLEIHTREDNLSQSTKVKGSSRPYTGMISDEELQNIVKGTLRTKTIADRKDLIDYYGTLKVGDYLELHNKTKDQSILVRVYKPLFNKGNGYQIGIQYIDNSYVGTTTADPIPQVVSRTVEDNKNEATINKKTGKPLSAGMWQEYEDNKREDVSSTSTLDAIVNGERTATTRWKHVDGFYDQMKKGDIIEFHDNKGRSILVKITKAPHKLSSDLDVEEWSKKEGWSVEYFEDTIREHVEEGEAYQLEYEYIKGSYVNPEMPARSRITDITISQKTDTDNYKKGTPQKHKDTAYIFTENALAHNKLEGKKAIGPDIFVVTNVNAGDKGKFNQADIRTNAKGEKTENAFGLIVKKYLLKTAKDWVAQEGCFEDTDEDFELFKKMNLEMFDALEKSDYKKIIFPFEVGLGKAALPKRFAEWLLKQLEFRYGIISTIELNKTPRYKGYGLRVSEVKKPSTVSVLHTEIKGENISSKGSDFAKQLTNYGNTVSVEFKGKTYRNAEHAYQTWKSGEFDEAAYNSTAAKPKGSKAVNKKVSDSIMVDILTAKLQQHPELVKGITDRGGIDYLNASTHDVIGDQHWETKDGKGDNGFIKALAQAYKNVTNNGLSVTESTGDYAQINKEQRTELIASTIELGENLDKETAIKTVQSMEDNSNPEFNDADNEVKKSLGNKPLKVIMASEHTDPSFHSAKICKMIKEDRQRPIGERKYHMLQIMTKHDGLPLLDMLELDIPKSVHLSITSLGGTKWEPGVMKADDLLDRIEDFIKQGKLNPNTTTIRIDPIIPGLTKEEDVRHIVERAKGMGIKQFKMSVMDSYGYDENSLNRKVMEKMISLGYDFDKYYTKYEATLDKSGKFVQIKGNTYYGQDAKPEVMKSIYDMVERIAEACDVRFATCGEKPSKSNYKKISFAQGCLSAKGVADVLGLKEDAVKNNTEEGNLRVGKCHCLNGKVDALAYNDTCLSACAYCYAEHGSDAAHQYYNEDGTLKDDRFTLTRRVNTIQSSIGPETSDKLDLEDYNDTEEDKLDAILSSAPEITTISESAPKSPLYTEYELQLIKEREALNALKDDDNALFKPSELSDLAKAFMFLVSDFITLINSSRDHNEEWFGYLEDSNPRKQELLNTDFTQMDRIEICHKLGFNMYAVIQNKYFNAANNPNGANMRRSLRNKLMLINENFNAFLEMGQEALARLEEIQFDNSSVHIVNELDEVFKDKNVEEITEITGSAIEHWQVSFRQVSAHASLSQLIKRAIGTLYKVDKNGEKVLNAFGIPERVNESLAINQILMWTQGSENLAQMVDKLKELKDSNPWLGQIISKLEENSEDETFKSQFWSNFKKYFLPYIIQYQKPIFNAAGELIGSVLTNKVINQRSLEKQMLDDFTALQQSRISEGTTMLLFNADGTINETIVKQFGEDLDTLKKYIDSYEENPEEAVAGTKTKAAIARIYRCFELDLDEDTIEALANDYNVIKDIYSHAKYIKTSKGLDLAVKNKTKDIDLTEKHRNDLESLFSHVVDNSATTLESVAYEDGKLHYSYVTPSYLSNLIEKLKGNTEDYETFLEYNYGKYEWFKSGEHWRNEWLRLLDENENYRKELQHAVVLTTRPPGANSISVGYRDKSPMLYEKSMLLNYFYGGSKSNWAFYRIPIMSNKPSEEYIRFWRYIKDTYKDDIAKLLVNVALQEIDRISTVRTRKADSNTEEIKSFDKNGSKFLFLDYLQPILEDYQKWQKDHEGTTLYYSEDEDGDIVNKRLLLGQMLEQRIQGTENYDNESYFKDVLISVIKDSMREKFEEYLEDMRKEGLLEKNEKTGEYVHLKDLLMLEGMSVEENLENFFWNDTFAAINILQLTITDIAYYKNAEDLQKRLAQIHAPGLRGNKDARWKVNGQMLTITDGKTRTIYLADFDAVVSDAIENIKYVFEKKALELEKTNPKEAVLYRELAKHIIEAFEDINVTDAEGYNSPTSYRKKAIAFGKWSDELEELYQNIRRGEYTTRDLEAMMQPLKPFVYSNTEKQSVGRLSTLKVGMQNKNSEYLLLMMDAILQGEANSGNPTLSKLAAIYQVMEESHYDSEGNYKTDGIDTVQFNSTVKAGEMGVIDINSAATTQLAKKIIEEAIYIDRLNKSLGYNLDRVHVLEFEDYCIQNEVPAHLEGESIFGSQMRILSISDMPEMVNGEEQFISFRNKKTSLRKVKQTYMKAIADNINESMQEIIKKFNITGTRAERNVALSKLLQEQIKGDSRFGYDLLYSVCTDEKGNFNIPLSDQINAGRVQLLLHSIIKTRINKQMIDGGPVVQVTNFGTSKELDIVFKDANGNRLPTLREWFALQDFSDFGSPSYEEFAVMHRYKGTSLYTKVYKPLREIVSKRYQEEIASKQAGIMYIECYAPSTVFKQFADEDGTIDLNKIPDEMKNLIGFRIPTEFKYSMAPLKIVGLLPSEAGEGIMLPKDITTLSGSDFDVDKLYIIRPVVKFNNEKFKEEFDRNSQMRYDAKGIWDYIYKHYPEVNDEINRAQDSYYEEQKALNNFLGTRKEALELANKKAKKDWLEFPEIYFDKAISDLEAAGELKKYQRGKKVTINGKVLSYSELRELRKKDANYYIKIENDNTRDGRNNIIFDTIYAMLTSEQAMDQIFTPGNFDEPKKYGYIAEAVRLHPEMTYEEILKKYEDAEKEEAGKGVDILKDLIAKSKNLVYNNVHLAFHKQNMVAGKLIGIFAQNNVSHSIISLIDHSVKTDKQGNILYDVAGKPKLWRPTILIEDPMLEIEGTIIGGGEVSFDALEDRYGKRISNTLAAFLAASVDAVKDPVLNFMNINETTAGILTTLVRMGYDTELAMLFLTQPIIKEVVTKYIIANEEKYVSLDSIIEKAIESLNKDGIDTDNLALPSINKKSLIKTLRGGSPNDSINLLRALKALSDISRTTSAIVSITKFNSVTAAAGPMLSNTMLMKQKVNENLNMITLQTESMQHALNNPIIKTFRETEFDAVEKLFRDMMLQASPLFSRIMSRVLEIMNGNMDDSMVNKLSDFYIAFLLASTENPIFKTEDNSNPISKSRREYIYKSLPWEIKKLLKKSDNKFLKLIRVMPKDDSHEYYWLKINTRGMNGSVHDDVGLYWQELYQENPDLAMALIEYNFVTSGLGYTPNSFANLVPVALKRVIPNYLQLLNPDRELNTEEENRLIDLFVRNNHSDSKIVKRVSKIKEGITYGNNYILISVGTSSIKKDQDTFYRYIVYGGRLYRSAGIKADKIKYVEVSKLGGKYGEILEINPSGEVEPADLKPKKQAKKEEDLKKKKETSSKEESEDFDVEVDDGSSKKKRTPVLDSMVAQIQWFILNKVPEAEQKDRISRLSRALYAAKNGIKEAPESSLKALFNTYSDNGYNEEAFSQMTNIRNVVFNAIQGINLINQDELSKKVKSILDTKNDLNICD